MASLYTIKGILILDNDGERILCKVSHMSLLFLHVPKKKLLTYIGT